MVWSTVQDHGGGINVESSEKGTSFALYFPVSTDGEPETRKEQTDLATLQGKGESILVVDDEPQQRDIAIVNRVVLRQSVDLMSGILRSEAAMSRLSSFAKDQFAGTAFRAQVVRATCISFRNINI